MTPFQTRISLFAALLLVLMIIGGVIAYQSSQWQRFEIMNPERGFTTVLHAEPSQERIHAISIRAHGKLVGGTGAISLGGMSPELAFSNEFDVQINKRDWYKPTCKIEFFATNVQAGTVVISYRFHD